MFCCLLTLLCARPAVAEELHLPGVRVAQFDADDTYDPFADYSEFDEAQEEEADINFFRNGRFCSWHVHFPTVSNRFHAIKFRNSGGCATSVSRSSRPWRAKATR